MWNVAGVRGSRSSVDGGAMLYIHHGYIYNGENTMRTVLLVLLLALPARAADAPPDWKDLQPLLGAWTADPAPDGATRADYWDSEGHVIRYGVTVDAGKSIVFLSEGAGPRYRLTYSFTGAKAAK